MSDIRGYAAAQRAYDAMEAPEPGPDALEDGPLCTNCSAPLSIPLGAHDGSEHGCSGCGATSRLYLEEDGSWCMEPVYCDRECEICGRRALSMGEPRCAEHTSEETT